LPADALDRLRRAATAKLSSRAMRWNSAEPRESADEDAARRRTSGPKKAVGDDEQS
jgi:hypothetical protein